MYYRLEIQSELQLAQLSIFIQLTLTDSNQLKKYNHPSQLIQLANNKLTASQPSNDQLTDFPSFNSIRHLYAQTSFS